MDQEELPVPEGAAVFPEIPPELGVHPLFLAVIHAIVFLAGSDEEIVNGPAAEEAVSYMAGYLQRLDTAARKRVSEDMQCIFSFARQEKWPKQMTMGLKQLLEDCGLESEEAK